MKFEIDWETATVENGVLCVSLGKTPGDPSAPTSWSEWGRIFMEVISQPSGGVEFTLSHVWGPIRLTDGVIRADNVNDSVVDEVRRTLDAAVAKTDQQFEAYSQRQEREAAQRRKQEERLVEQDRGLTERFRSPAGTPRELPDASDSASHGVREAPGQLPT